MTDDIPFWKDTVLYFPHQNRYNLYCKLTMYLQKSTDKGHTDVQPWFPWNRNWQGHQYTDFIFGLEGMNNRFESVTSCYISCADLAMILCSITNSTTLPLCTTLSLFTSLWNVMVMVHTFPSPPDTIWSQICSLSSPLMCHTMLQLAKIRQVKFIWKKKIALLFFYIDLVYDLAPNSSYLP